MTPERWVLASGNAGKLAEFQALVEPLGVELAMQRALGIEAQPELAVTFIENAIAKARHASACSGLPALADDSGLAVATLNGAPGLYSARFAGPGASDAANIARLLAALETADSADRSAAFICAIAWLAHAEDPAPLVSIGRWPGWIADVPRGDGGFGYDPVFEPERGGLTVAQMSAQAKNQVSHRARAWAQIFAQLRARQNIGSSA